MRAIVLYESMFGNTKAVAEAIAAGLTQHGQVAALEVGDVDGIPRGTDLLVAGGPTHAFGLTRASTRADAASRAHAPLVSRGKGMREWSDALACLPTGLLVATFDTRLRRPRVPGSAAKALAKRLAKKGGRPIVGPETFWVGDVLGPLLDGELERARSWGYRVGADASASPALAFVHGRDASVGDGPTLLDESGG